MSDQEKHINKKEAHILDGILKMLAHNENTGSRVSLILPIFLSDFDKETVKCYEDWLLNHADKIVKKQGYYSTGEESKKENIIKITEAGIKFIELGGYEGFL